MSATSLHGLRAVAPLRRSRQGGVVAASTRVSTASGPWPHCGFSSSSGLIVSTTCLHGLRAVAPLRPFTGALRVWPDTRVSTASGPWPHCGVPVPGGRPGEDWSPRPQGRGPIAASGHASHARYPSRLHGLRAVAPLRRLTPTTATEPPSSPRPQGRGPIAAGHRAARGRGGSAVSTASGPWPHCGHVPVLHPRQAGQVSTASGPWPHCGALLIEEGQLVAAGLHGLRAVAPLRPGSARPGAPRSPWSPRPQGRGPIAARSAACPPEAASVSTASGPWPHCGPTKLARRPRARGWSPRPQGRGPIAATHASASTPRPSSLHGLRAVAPLRRTSP